MQRTFKVITSGAKARGLSGLYGTAEQLAENHTI